MNHTAVEAYRYVGYRGATSQSRGMGAPTSIFSDVQSAAVGWIQDEERRFLFFKDEGHPIAQELMISEFSMNNDYIRKVLNLQKSAPPDRLLNIEAEYKGLQKDRCFPGDSFWTGSKSSTEIDNYQRFWGIHESGLIVSDDLTGEFLIGENHYHQFPLLVVEDGPWIKRLYNSQNDLAVSAFVAMATCTDPQKVQDCLACLEKKFVQKYPVFQSKYEFLEKSAFSDNWKARVTEETTLGALLCSAAARAMILPLGNEGAK